MFVRMEPEKEYSTLQWYEYRQYQMSNTSDVELTIDQYFELQEKRKQASANVQTPTA